MSHDFPLSTHTQGTPDFWTQSGSTVLATAGNGGWRFGIAATTKIFAHEKGASPASRAVSAGDLFGGWWRIGWWTGRVPCASAKV